MLFKVDHASMAASVEARAFYLYHPLVEFTLSLPIDRLIRQDGKYLLKRYLERYVPKENLYRPKHGFGLKQGHHKTWLDPSMQNYLRGNPERAQRLYFGACSLYEWLHTQEAIVRRDLNSPPVK